MSARRFRRTMTPSPSGFGTVAVIIPVLNEAEALPKVLAGIPSWVTHVVVADNGSIDGSGDIARRAGAIVVVEPRRGYGSACLKAIAALPPETETIVFMDGDASDDAGAMAELVGPIARGEADMVLGSRTMGAREAGALSPQQIFGNALACTLIRMVWGVQFSDLGPFRAIGRRALERLQMALAQNFVTPNVKKNGFGGVEAGKLDKSMLPNLVHMDPFALGRVAHNDPGNAHAIPWMWGTAGLGYNPAMVAKVLGTDRLDSWDAVFDPAVASKLAKCGIAILDAASGELVRRIEIVPAVP